jgi:NAD(P)-dependent dehydrogenase (short-subunit alcohol dehydrogenase family)
MTAYKDLFDLKGRTAVVTGGCGILGRRFAEGLAEFGAKVAIVDLDQTAVGTAASEVSARFPIDARGYACDITQPEIIRRTAEAIEADLGPVSILLNNAASKTRDVDAFFAPGRNIRSGNLAGDHVRQPRRHVQRGAGVRNPDGRARLWQHCPDRLDLRLMAPDQRIYEGSEYLGRAINTPAVYTASKAGVIGLTKHLATYWARTACASIRSLREVSRADRTICSSSAMARACRSAGWRAPTRWSARCCSGVRCGSYVTVRTSRWTEG